MRALPGGEVTHTNCLLESVGSPFGAYQGRLSEKQMMRKKFSFTNSLPEKVLTRDDCNYNSSDRRNPAPFLVVCLYEHIKYSQRPSHAAAITQVTNEKTV